MSGLNLLFIPLTTLQQVFFDKLTGTVLANGRIEFYRDIARTEAKDVYVLSGNPPDYTYVSIGNVITLGSFGEYADNLGNQIVPYLYPYDGTPSLSNGTVDLYFADVYNAEDVFQFSVGGFPNAAAVQGQDAIEGLVNIINNGQFLIHNNFLDNGKIVPNTQVVAPGWRIYKTSSSATDYVRFPRFGSPITNPSGNPKYAANIICTSPNPGDTSKRFFAEIENVTSLASATQQYTFFFSGQNNGAGSVSIPVYLLKNYGAGGSSNTTTIIGTVNISPTYTNFNIIFTYGDNSGKILGTDNGFFQIGLDLPPELTFDISVTDFCLVQGAYNLVAYPFNTNQQVIASTLPGSLPIPDPTGLDIGCPVIPSLSGLVYDHSMIGYICATIHSTAGAYAVLCNGAKYDVALRNAAGIPYSRIAAVTFNYTYNMPMFGGGVDFVSVYPTDTPEQMIFSTNKAGAVTATADGIIPTGFSFLEMTTGSNSYGFKGLIDGLGNIYVQCVTPGVSLPVPNPMTAPGDTPFTVLNDYVVGINDIGNITKITLNAITPLAGKYFTLTNPNDVVYPWFIVDGVGTSPAYPYPNFSISILSTHTMNDVEQILKDAVTGHATTNIIFLPAASITPGAYFTFYNADGDLYYVWYEIAGIGTDPAVVSAVKGIKVALEGTETAADVARDTQYATATTYWTAPSFEGAFLRMWQSDSTFILDPDNATRLAGWKGNAGNKIGSFQHSQNSYHQHATTPASLSGINFGQAGGNTFTSGGYTIAALSLAASGGNQANPVNYYVNYEIRI